MTKEKLLFVVHRGTVSGRPAGIIGYNHALPIACSHSSLEVESGIHALWEATTDVEEFFEWIGVSSIEAFDDRNPSGLYVFEVEYDEDRVNVDDPDDWSQLSGGELRRPTAEELAPLAEGKAPWEGGKVL